MDQKVALISGGSRGLGREVAFTLANQGYITVIAYAGNQIKADETVEMIHAQGGRAQALQTDVGDIDAVEQLFKTIHEEFGRIDAVINTAAISILKPIDELSSEEADRIITTNIKGTFNILKYAGQYIKEGGRILTFSSNVVESLPINYAMYAASKAAVEAMSKIMSKELRGREISVNIISPGPTATDMFLEGKSPELIEHFAKLSPFERLGQPQDIVKVIQFLLSDDAGWINGQVIKINGGSS